MSYFRNLENFVDQKISGDLLYAAIENCIRHLSRNFSILSGNWKHPLRILINDHSAAVRRD